MFLAFIKLRKTDPNAERPYSVPVKGAMVYVTAIVPFVLLVAGIIFTLFGDFTSEFITDSIPLYVGVGISFIIEEILVARISTKK